MTRVKICGITRAEDALLAAELGASAIGFIFWPGSARFIAPERAAEIAAQMPSRIVCVGVFVDQTVEHMREVAALVPLGAIQLHGNEPPEVTTRLLQPVIKAVPVAAGFMPESVESIPSAVTVLLDAHDPVKRGGTGRAINWSLAATVARRRPVMLSGGLNPINVRQALYMVRPYGIDLASGVESAPGVKDPDKLKQLFEALKDQ